MAKLSPVPVWQIFDDNGVTVPGALLYTYEAGTDTPKATYTDHTGDTANPNPIVADAAARMTIWLGNGNYKFILTDGENATLFDPDHVEGNVIWAKDYISATGGLGGFMVVENLDALRALTDYDSSTAVYVEGYVTVGDGGGGWFYYNSDSNVDDNDGTWILPDSVPVSGRWFRFVESETNVRWFGAGTNNGELCDTQLQAAFNYSIEDKSDVFIPSGTYNCGVSTEITRSCRVRCEGAVFEKIGNHTDPIFTAESLASIEMVGAEVEGGPLISITNCTNVSIHGCKTDGRILTSDVATRIIELNGCINVEVYDNVLMNADAHIYVTSVDGTQGTTYSDNINIHGNKIYNAAHGHLRAYPTAITVVYSKNTKIHDNHIAEIIPGTLSQVYGKYAYAIYEEGGENYNLLVRGNTIEVTVNNDAWSGIYFSSSQRVVVSENTIRYIGNVLSASTLAINGNVSSTSPDIAVKDNMCVGARISVSLTTTGRGSVECSGNTVRSSADSGISIVATNQSNTKSAIVSDNTVHGCVGSGIVVTQFMDSFVRGNRIIDINTGNSAAVENRSGIYFVGMFQGNVCNNTIENGTTGHARYGIDFSVSDYQTRWMYRNNSFIGMETGHYNAGYTGFPYGLKWEVGDKTSNTLSGDLIADEFECITSGVMSSQYEAAQGEYFVVCLIGDGGAAEISPGDMIGITLQNGTVQWTICNHISPDYEATPNPVVNIYFDDQLTSYHAAFSNIYYRRWKNTAPQSADVYIKGASGDGGVREIRVNGRRVLSANTTTNSSTGLTLTTFSAADMSFKSSGNYDIVADSGRAEALADAIEHLPKGDIGIITSQGVYNTGIEATIVAAAARVGLYKLMATPTGTALDYAYAAIFLGAYSGASYNNKSAIEVLQSYNAGCPDAIISIPVYKGGLPNGLVNALASGNPARTDPALYADANDSLVPYGRVLGKQGSDVQSTTNISLGYSGNFFNILTGAAVHRIDITGWSIGSAVTLIVPVGASLVTDDTTSGVYNGIIGGTVDGPAAAILNLRDSGTSVRWMIVSRYQYA